MGKGIKARKLIHNVREAAQHVCVCGSLRCVPFFVTPHGLQPPQAPLSPGLLVQNTGVGCHTQKVSPAQGQNLPLHCILLRELVDSSPLYHQLSVTACIYPGILAKKMSKGHGNQTKLTDGMLRKMGFVLLEIEDSEGE